MRLVQHQRTIIFDADSLQELLLLILRELLESLVKILTLVLFQGWLCNLWFVLFLGFLWFFLWCFDLLWLFFWLWLLLLLLLCVFLFWSKEGLLVLFIFCYALSVLSVVVTIESGGTVNTGEVSTVTSLCVLIKLLFSEGFVTDLDGVLVAKIQNKEGQEWHTSQLKVTIVSDSS